MNLFTASVRKHKAALLISVLFLCLEAVFCLISPAVLGNIIDKGVQSKGITEPCPLVMSSGAFSLFEKALPAKEWAEFSDAYELLENAPSHIPESYKVRRESYYLKENADKEKTAEIFRNAVWSSILIAREYEGVDELDYDTLVKKVSMTSLYLAASRLELSAQDIENNYSLAVNAPNTIKLQTASLLLPYICDDAGVDCLKIQSEYINHNALIMALCVVLQFICACGGAYFLSRFSAEAEKEMRRSLLKRTFLFSKKEFSALSPSYVNSTITDGIRQIGMSANYGIRPLIYAPVLALAGTAIIVRKNVLFGCLVIASSLLITATIVLIYLLTYKRYYRMQETFGEYSFSVRYNLAQLFTIRSNNAQKTERRKLNRLSALVRKDESFVMKSVLSALSVTSLLINALTAAVVVLGGKSMLNMNLGIGDVVTYLQYSVIIVTSFMTLGAIVIFAPKALKALKDIDAIENTPLSQSEYEKNKKSTPDVISKIIFDKVRLFENTEEISFTAEKGEVTLIDGKTGTGKSLLIDALLREHKPFSGNIYIDGENILSLSSKYPSDCVSLTASRPVLFSDTIRNNLLLLGAADSDEEMLEALKKAGCDFIRNSSEALDIFLKNSGEMFSGGQRSRLCLAGAFARKAKVYIFDDCFSSLDESTREKVLNNVRRLADKHIVIIISHSEPEKQIADKIITLGD